MKCQTKKPMVETKSKHEPFFNPIDTIWFILQAAKVIITSEIIFMGSCPLPCSIIRENTTAQQQHPAGWMGVVLSVRRRDHKWKKQYVRKTKKGQISPLAIDLCTWWCKMCVPFLFVLHLCIHVWRCACVHLHTSVCTQGKMLACWCVFTDDAMPKKKNPTGWINR